MGPVHHSSVRCLYGDSYRFPSASRSGAARQTYLRPLNWNAGDFPYYQINRYDLRAEAINVVIPIMFVRTIVDFIQRHSRDRNPFEGQPINVVRRDCRACQLGGIDKFHNPVAHSTGNSSFRSKVDDSRRESHQTHLVPS